MAAAQAQHEEMEEMEDDGGPILINKLEQHGISESDIKK